MHAARLGDTRDRLADGSTTPEAEAEAALRRLEILDPSLRAFVDEPERRDRVTRAARDLASRHAAPSRPALYGVPCAVKDIFHMDGLPTTAGSQVPPDDLAGAQADAVSRLLSAGAIVLGKTITAEFALTEPGPTCNPHDPERTPGGSSSGSAAAVAAGICPVALGTQTVGSVIRPAAYCGVVGFKPTYGRVPIGGVIPCSPSVDTVGVFAQDVAGVAAAAAVLCRSWSAEALENRLPVLGIPDGPYLDQADADGRRAFDAQVTAATEAGYAVERVALLNDIDEIAVRHRRMVCGEMARIHAAWFDAYEPVYRPGTAAAIRQGRDVTADQLEAGRAGRHALRRELEEVMDREGVDLWISPAATGPAPHGLGSTGNPAMNLPWTHAQLPVVTVPGGHAGGLPVGLQLVSRWMLDEQLLTWADALRDVYA